MRRFLQLMCLTAALATAASAADVPQAPAVEPPSPTATVAELHAQADRLHERKMFREAIEYYEAALKKEKSALLWNKKGISELQAGRTKDAERSFKRAMKIDPTYAYAHNNLGAVFHRLKKKPGRAIKHYRKAIELNSDVASFHSNLGTALFAEKKYEEAVAEYRNAMVLDPQIFERTSTVGVSAQLSPEDRAHFSYVLAKIFAQNGDFDRSLQYLRRAVEDGYKNVDDAFKDTAFEKLRQDPRFTDLMATNRPVTVPQ